MKKSSWEDDNGPSGRETGNGDAMEFLSFYDFGQGRDGKLVDNNAHTGYAQGKGSSLRKAKCKVCGIPALHLERDAHDGGSLDGNGAGGANTTSSDTVTLLSGATYVENVGSISHNKGAGCPFCYSRNGSDETELPAEEPALDSTTRIGF